VSRESELLELVLEQNPFHRARLGGERPRTLAQVPLLEKRELVDDQRLHPPFGTNLTFPIEAYTHVHQTSGTTGPPLRVLDTREDWEWWASCLATTYRAAGIGPGDRVALAFSFGPHVQFWDARDGLERVGAMSLTLGGMSSVQRLQTLAQVEATALVSTPSYALRLYEVAVEENLEGALASLEKVICAGEPGASLPAVRARIEEGLGVRVFDHAGLSETGPFGYPCAEGGGLHINGDEFVCEILTHTPSASGTGDADLRPAAPGERGELVLTPLGRRGWPVLRYRTGDVVVNAAETCPAGHPHPWLPGGIVGRTDDMVVIRGMNVYPSAIEQAVRDASDSGEFRLTFYTEQGGMDEVKLEVELARGATARTLQDVMRQQLGLRVRVVPVGPGVLPRTEGKARRVMDLRRSGVR
jgi:phenylacetate-CoA ligase